MKRLSKGVGLIVALMLLLSVPVRGQVMQQLPPNTLMVIKVNNLKATSDKLAKLAQDLGIAALAPPAADPLAFLQVQLQMQQGLDTSGELAFAMLDPGLIVGATGPEDALVILAPVTDYKTFLSNWPAAKTEGEISEVTIGGDTSYVTSWGKYAAIAPAKAVLAARASGGIAAPPVSTKELSGRDIILYANMSAIRGKLLPELQRGKTEMQGTFEQIFAQQPQFAKFTPLIKVAFNQLMNVADTYLREADGATFGLSFTPEGINAAVTTEFTPRSYLGNAVSSIKGTDAPLMTGLPQGKYLFMGGGLAEPAVTGKVLADLIDPIVTEALAMGPEWVAAKDYADALKQSVTAAKSQSFAMVAPQGAVGAESLLQLIVVQTGDAKAMLDASAKMLAAQNKLVTALNLGDMPGILPKHVPAAKTIDGVTFDSMVTKIEMDPQNPMAMQQAQMMNIIYGPEGAVFHYGAVGTDKMLVLSGVKDPMISATIAAAKQNSNVLDQIPGVKAVAAQLPKTRTSVAYINVAEMATTGLSYARQFGLALPVMLPSELPPVGIAGGTEGTAIRIDVHVPTVLVQSFIAAGLQVQAQMQGGGPPPGGGL